MKMAPGDEIRAYGVEGTLANPGEVLASSTLDEQSGIATLELSPDRSYRIRLRRKEIEYMETIVLIDQFPGVSGDILDIGDLGAISTVMTWGAYSTASSLEDVSVESALREVLRVLSLVSDEIRVLSDLNRSAINEPAFSATRIAQLNVAVVMIARMSKQLETEDYSQEQWDAKADLLAEIFAKIASKETSKREHYEQLFLESFNNGENSLALIDAEEVTNQFIGSEDLSEFVALAQSSDSDSIAQLFTLMGM
ncbi:MAG: hypothetical protein HQL32_05010 [Planctomycetes bacterium]|nr:hypothetical protein [Planctomycetota bacterium]